MHEYSIAYDIYATAKKAAEDNFATNVKKVHVGLGELTMINPEQVIFLFETMCEEDPIFKDCKIECKNIQVKTECECGYSGGERFVCPQCGKLPVVVEGMEILVTNIEIEVEDEED
ncbi:MAG: hydrogenase maturation nickel metallochaperone HypA [Methanomicrobiaceae archaeon]|nr:hydrogenase maturation nickel metallochaperone HypA [Methanomicrobiaceae archaeon]